MTAEMILFYNFLIAVHKNRITIPDHSQETKSTARHEYKEDGTSSQKDGALNHVTIFWQTTDTKCLYFGIPGKI